MKPLSPRGRRAEEFNALLEGDDSSGHARDAELLEVVGALRTVPEITPRPEYVTDLRERLTAEADLVLSDVERKLTLPTPQRTRRDRRIAIAAGAVALVGVSSSVAFASQGALPGDTLYPIKRAIEGASTSLTFDDAAKGDRMLENAAGRLAEVEQLAQRSATDEGQYRETLTTFSDQSREAADLLLEEYADTGSSQGVERLRVFASSSIDKLATLSGRLPAGADDALETAVTTLTEIDNLVHEVCPGCSGGISELPATLAQLTASEIEPAEKEPATEPPTTLVPEYTYTDENAVGGNEQQQQGDDQRAPGSEPERRPEQKKQGDDDKRSKKPKGTLEKTTKDLGDLLAGDKGLLGDDGVVGGLLENLLGKEGLVGGLLGGTSSDEE